MSAGRLLHLSDIHFGDENAEALQGVLEAAAAGDFDLTVITGDITQFGRRREFAAAGRWVAGLPGPIVITPGNHDVPYASPSRLWRPFERFSRVFGAPWTCGLDGAGIRVRGFNSSRGVQWRLNWSKGVARPSLVEGVAGALSKAGDGVLKVAVCHHPLMEVTGGPMTGEVRGGEEAVGVLAAAGVDALLTGHVHTAFAHEMPPSGSGLYAIGAGTLSRRERGQPAGFNILEWNTECIIVKAQAWTGSHFETVRTWALPRKARSNASKAPGASGA